MNSDMPGPRSCALEPLLYVYGTDYIKKDIGKKCSECHRGLDGPVDRSIAMHLVPFCASSLVSLLPQRT